MSDEVKMVKVQVLVPNIERDGVEYNIGDQVELPEELAKSYQSCKMVLIMTGNEKRQAVAQTESKDGTPVTNGNKSLPADKKSAG